MTIVDLPHLNAALNSASTLLLVMGFAMIRRGHVRAHATLMLAALATSAGFLASYLVYHYHAGEKSTAHMTWLPHGLRLAYLIVLFTHLVLATVVLPLILLTLWRAARRRWTRHRAIARPTLLIWLYVSITGVAIYACLYHLFPALQP